MKTVLWSPRAIVELRAHRLWMKQQDEQASNRMTDDIEAIASALGRDIDTGRPSQYPGLREKSLLKWRKVLIYHQSDGGIEIVALLDTRMQQPKKL